MSSKKWLISGSSLLIATVAVGGLSNGWRALAADTPPAPPAVTPPPAVNPAPMIPPYVMAMQAGNYDYTTYNKGDIQRLYLTESFARTQADREFFLAAIKDVEAQFKTFYSAVLFGNSSVKGLKQMSDSSMGVYPVFTNAEDFLTAVNYYHQGKAALENKIAGLESIQGALPSQMQAQVDGAGVKDGQGVLKIDFKPLTSFYTGKIAEVETFLNNLPQSLMVTGGDDGKGLPYFIKAGSGKGLTLDAPKYRASRDQITKWRADVVRLRKWDAAGHDSAEAFTKSVAGLLLEFIRDYGTTERFRFHNEQDDKARDEVASQILLSFWSRSYMRTVYGVPMGVIAIDYHKSIANLDMFTVSTDALTEIKEEPAWTQKELMRVKQSIELALGVAKDRSVDILNGNTTLLPRVYGVDESSAKAGALPRINAAMTFLGGKAELAICSHMMLALMASDLYEEQLVQQPGGVAQMIERYKSRYYADEKSKADFKKLEASFDPEDSDADATHTGFIAAGTVFEKFETLRQAARQKVVDIQQASDLEKQIAVATGWDDLKSAQALKARKKLLD